MTTQIHWIALIIFILICQAVGIVGSFFTIRSIPTWYKALKKPWFNPPNWIFGPVWTLLYFLMGIVGYLLWENAKGSSLALKFFFIQLILNAVWTPLFFGAKKLGWSLFEIIFMLLAILGTIISSWHTELWAAVLLIPYLAWVSFASILNYNLWIMNKNSLSKG